MLDDLVSVIETLKQRIHDHGTSLRANETRTRMAMIDPMLRALGWDPADPSVVTPEYDVSGRWADYALLGTDGKPDGHPGGQKVGRVSGHSPNADAQLLQRRWNRLRRTYRRESLGIV